MKKITLAFLTLVILGLITAVYYIGGSVGAYAWCLAVFVIAPVSAVLIIVQLINLIYRYIKKKSLKWSITFTIVTLILALPISVIFGVSPIVYPDHASEIDSIEVQYPVANGIYLGGKSYKTHAYWPSERYAYDVVKEPYDIGSPNLNDYGIYGDEVISPVYGTIIAVENDEPDIAPNSSEFTSALGNYVLIKIDKTDTYMILAHFKQNSIYVSVGDKVIARDKLGLVGNSGTTSEPHLHIQHQRENPLNVLFAPAAEGLPIDLEIFECSPCD